MAVLYLCIQFQQEHCQIRYLSVVLWLKGMGLDLTKSLLGTLALGTQNSMILLKPSASKIVGCLYSVSAIDLEDLFPYLKTRL